MAKGQMVARVALTNSPDAVSAMKATMTAAGAGRITGDTFMLTTCHSTRKPAPDSTTIAAVLRPSATRSDATPPRGLAGFAGLSGSEDWLTTPP